MFMPIPPKVFPLRPLVVWRTSAANRFIDNRLERRCDASRRNGLGGRSKMDRTIEEHCVVDQDVAEGAGRAPAGQGSAAGQPGEKNMNGRTGESADSVRVIKLGQAGKGNYVAGRSVLMQLIWFVFEAAIINNKWIPVSGPRVWALRLFGARIGRDCRFTHPMRVKEPWKLEVGDNTWFGMNAYIYNQAPVRIGSNVCISQEVFLTAGSHDVTDTMDLRVQPIVIEDGAWISSRCIVQMGVTIGRSVVVTPLSVVHRSLDAGGVYGGNPARFIKKRFAS
jgi:putative colanic acid biosynthesis acetyltransferase WcaF